MRIGVRRVQHNAGLYSSMHWPFVKNQWYPIATGRNNYYVAYRGFRAQQ